MNVIRIKGIVKYIKELDIPYYRPKGVGLKIDYIIPTNINIGVEVKYQEDGQTAYEKVPHAGYKYVFHNPIKLDELWILLNTNEITCWLIQLLHIQ